MKNKLSSSNYLLQKPLLSETKKFTFFSGALEQKENNSTFLPPSSTVISKSLPPSTKQWMNSIYSFNKTYTKSLPSVDSIVTKIMKGFFTINPLANNPGGKKSRLVQRRFKRLSLNKIFVSKPEIKHSNNKVFITVYLFNKKKRSLLLKLKDLYENITYKTTLLQPNSTKSSTLAGKSGKSFLFPISASIGRQWRSKQKAIKRIASLRALKPIFKKYKQGAQETDSFTNNKKNLVLNALRAQRGTKKNNILEKMKVRKGKALLQSRKNKKTTSASKMYITRYLSKKALARLYKKHKRIIGKSNSLYRVIRKPKLKRIILSTRHKYKYRYRNRNLYVRLRKGNYKGFTPYNRKTLVRSFNNKLVNYKVLNLSLKRKISKYISSLNSYSSHNRVNSDLSIKRNLMPLSPSQSNLPIRIMSNKLLKSYYSCLNKYKLYNVFSFDKNKSVFSVVPYNTVSNLAATVTSLNAKPTFTLTLPKKNNAFFGERKNILALQKKHVSLYKKNRVFFGEKETFSHLKKSILGKRGKLNASMHKLNALYRLFTLYGNIPYYNTINDSSPLHHSKQDSSKTLPSLSLYSVKLVLNTYKLLKKSVSFEKLNLLPLSLITKNGKNKKNSMASNLKKGRNVSESFNKNLSKHNNASTSKELLLKPLTMFLYLYNNKKLNEDKARRRWLRTIRRIRKGKTLFFGGRTLLKHKTKRAMHSIIIMEKLKKINRFFKKYRNLLLKKNSHKLNTNLQDSEVLSKTAEFAPSNVLETASVKNISTLYKLHYLKEILDKELLYIYYVKMVSFNNNIFKNWFLNSLKNVLSKIYNKKVILNLVNLKYIHLNSDIFTQAIAIRLRNFKKNRLNKVLRKALKLIVVSRINIYSYDIHSAANKFIEQYYNKFKDLNHDIFNDVSTSTLNGSHSSNEGKSSYYSLKPLKGLNYKDYAQQSNTINFIRHKSVFGVKLEAGGRLTKRSTASRAIFKIRYKGNLRNNLILNRKDTSTIIGNQRISNLQFTKISSKTRNGSFGLKGWLNNN